MICEACHGIKPADGIPCKACGGSGFAHCCDGPVGEYEIGKDCLMNEIEARRTDISKIGTRQTEITPEQSAAIEAFYSALKKTCPSAEAAVAVIVHGLTEFLMQTSKPQFLPEAVETAILCIRQNTGVIGDIATFRAITKRD